MRVTEAARAADESVGRALVQALEEFMHPAFAALLVGVAVAALGGFLVRAGLRMLKPEHLTPDRSARQLRKDAQLMKGR